jgi:uncharacterized protein YbbK (DUF523 family)
MPRLAHLSNGIETLRIPTEAEPLRILISGCIMGMPCGVDGTDYGMGGALAPLTALPTVTVKAFCPEDVGLGTPRGMPDIHGGDGFDVLDGTARVLDQFGNDLTDGMITGAAAMAEFARSHAIELAVLTDMSAACGTQVISDGGRFAPERRYRAGVGVASATLLRHGIPVLAQRDYRSLERLMVHCGAEIEIAPDRKDHHQTEWFVQYFGS